MFQCKSTKINTSNNYNDVDFISTSCFILYFFIIGAIVEAWTDKCDGIGASPRLATWCKKEASRSIYPICPS